MQGCLNTGKSINVILLINRIKYGDHIIISLDAEKTFDKIQYQFIISVLERAGGQGTYFPRIKTVYSKFTDHFFLTGENLKASPPKSGRSHECPLAPYSFTITLEVLFYYSHKTTQGE